MLNIDFAEMEARVMATNQSMARAVRHFSKKVRFAQAYGMGPTRLNSVMHGGFLKIVGTVDDWYRLQAFVALAPCLQLELRPKPAGKRKQLIGKVEGVAGPGAEFMIVPPRTRHEHTLDQLIARVEPFVSQPYFITSPFNDRLRNLLIQGARNLNSV